MRVRVVVCGVCCGVVGVRMCVVVCAYDYVVRWCSAGSIW